MQPQGVYPDLSKRDGRIGADKIDLGLTDRSQLDVASPRSIAPKAHKSTCRKRNEMEGSEETDGFGKRKFFQSGCLTSKLPDRASDIGHSDVSRQTNDSMKSGISALTASTERRQSVRDLFREYGIERPDGLAPYASPLSSLKGEPNHGDLSPNSSGKETHCARYMKKHNISPIPNDHVKRLTNQITKFSSYNRPQSPTLLTGNRTENLVKDSPFLIADRISKDWVSQALMGQGDSVRRPEARSKKPIPADCDSSRCRATHKDHEPYRHSVSCSLKREHVPEETEYGCVADPSFVKGPRSEAPIQSQKLRVWVSHRDSEYVECHGYPRTGHGRHGSATSRALGQCQHCTDDCHCSSCQSAHHSVRCCMNEDHQSVVHRHRRSSNARHPHIHLDCPNLSSLASPASNTAAPPTKRQKVEKSMSLPRSKNSTLLQKEAKPQPAVDLLNREESTVGTWVRTLSDPWHKDENHPNCDTPTGDLAKSSEEHALSPNVRSPSKASQATTLDSGKQSRTFSELLPLMNQKPLQHQEEFKRIEKQCDERHEVLARENVTSSTRLQPKSSLREKKARSLEREASRASRASSNETFTAAKKNRWAFGLGDQKSTSTCCTDAPTPIQEQMLSEDENVLSGNDLPVQERMLSADETVPSTNKPPVQEHLLSDDLIVDENGNEKRLSVAEALIERAHSGKCSSQVPQTLVDSLIGSIDKIEEHECAWKTNFIAHQNSTGRQNEAKEIEIMPIRGLTIVVHVEGRDDLIMKADLGKGSVVRPEQ